MGLSSTPTLTPPSPDLWMTTSLRLCQVLGMTLDALAFPATMPSLSSTGWCPLCLLSVFHGPRTSLTFDIDLEAPAVLTTRCGDTAFPDPTVPKSQAWHLELGCSPIWLHNGLGGLRDRGRGHTTDNIHPCGRYTSIWTDEGQKPRGSPSIIGLTPCELWSGQWVELEGNPEGPGV